MGVLRRPDSSGCWFLPLLARAFVFSLLVVRKTRWAAGSRPHTSRVSHWDRDYCVLCFHIV